MGVIVCRREMRDHILASVHVVMTLLGNRNGADRHRPVRTQHGSRDATPNGEQDGEQDHDEDAEVFHCERLSDSGSADGSPLKSAT